MSTSAVPQKNSPRVLIPIADGSEEIETVCLQDTLVRFGADVTVASIMPERRTCIMSRGLRIEAHALLSDCLEETYDLIVLPGGMPGAEHLRDCAPLITKLKQQQGFYAAMCAAPAVTLAPHGLLPATATCYPAPKFRAVLQEATSTDVSDQAVVVSDRVITSQGPGTALLFALQLGELLFGVEKRQQIAKEMLVT
jgi:protein deglycase